MNGLEQDQTSHTFQVVLLYTPQNKCMVMNDRARVNSLPNDTFLDRS